MMSLSPYAHRCMSPVISSLALSACLACGEEEQPNLPTFVESSATMRCVFEGDTSYLSELSFIVEDLDGSDTLRAPSVELRSLSLTMEAEALSPSEEERCGLESCRVEYSWRFDAAEHGRVSCGEDGASLTAQITISDENGHTKVERLTSQVE